MTFADAQPDPGPIELRMAVESDCAALRDLFEAGLLERQVPSNDTGADIDNLMEAYFSDEGQSGFWIAEDRGDLIGMIGVQRASDHTAEIRRLRVREDYRRRGVGSMLLKEALEFCRRLGYLKVVLDVRIERGPAISMLEKFGFKLTRTREVNGRKLLDFYIDLYSDPKA